jgi:hypothetical protein
LDIAKTVLRKGTLDVNHVRSTAQLSASRMSALVAAIRKADFFTLPHSIPPDPNLHHARVLFLSVQLSGLRNEVLVFYPATVRGSRVTRAKRLWAALLRELPSPNQNSELRCFYWTGLSELLNRSGLFTLCHSERSRGISRYFCFRSAPQHGNIKRCLDVARHDRGVVEALMPSACLLVGA